MLFKGGTQEASSVSLPWNCTLLTVRSERPKQKRKAVCTWGAAGSREEGHGQKGCVRSVESHGSANGEASPEPEGSLRRTALAFSRCKAGLRSTSRQWQMSGLVRKWCTALAAKENANADAPTSPAASQGSFKY